MSNQTSEPATPVKLNPWTLAGQAYASVFGDFGWFLRTTWAWVVVTALVIVLRESFIPEDQQWTWLAPEILFYLAASSSVAVAWHRRLLLHERPVPVFYLRFGKEELRFFWRFLGLIVGVIMIPAMALLLVCLVILFFTGSDLEQDPGFFMWLALMTLALATPWLLGVRLLPILCTVAIGKTNFSIVQSWRATGGNTWRLWFALMLATLAANTASYVPVLWLEESAELGAPGNPLLDIAFEILSLVIGYLALALTIATASHAYARLVGAPVETDLVTAP